MDPTDLEESALASPSLHVSSEQRQVLDQLCLCHERGPGPRQGNVRSLRIILFFAFCLAISAGLIVFANRIPPEIGFLLVGFIVGALAMATWQQRRFERQWPLIQMIIDWKFVERLRNGSDPADERAL